MPVTAAAASAKEQPAPRADRRGGIDMTESILVALISGGLTLLGVIMSCHLQVKIHRQTQR